MVVVIYHAHVVRPAEKSSYEIALHLRHIFTTYGKIENAQEVAEQQSASTWYESLIGIARSCLKYMRKVLE